MLNKNIRLILVVLITLALSSCATKAKLVAQKQTWIDKGIVEYTQHFGKPNSVINVSQNEETYVYLKSSVNHAARSQALSRSGKLTAIANDNNNPNLPGSLKCTTWVSFNKETKIITNITFRGNFCVTRDK